MGYRVGHQCFMTSEQAHDYILSQQLPVITADGKIIRPIKYNQDWYLQGQKVDLSLPRCDVVEQMTLGAFVGLIFMLVILLVFTFKTIYKMIYMMGGDDG